MCSIFRSSCYMPQEHWGRWRIYTVIKRFLCPFFKIIVVRHRNFASLSAVFKFIYVFFYYFFFNLILFRYAGFKVFTANNELWSLTCSHCPRWVWLYRFGRSLCLSLLHRLPHKILIHVTDFRMTHTLNVCERFEIKNLCVI